MRDFFYNKGDVFIAVLIILIAAFVIYIRVGVIMDYSATGDNRASLWPFGSGPSTSETTGDGGRNPGPHPGEAPPEDEDPVVTPPVEEDPPIVYDPGATEIQITVNAGDAASTIADKLFAANLIMDRPAFLDAVMTQGADSLLKTGTFTIPMGASNEEIIAILTG